tara:strand:+ start:84 stop:659 length:576 start_codon:yes stop_codon:yes gene_type:complete
MEVYRQHGFKSIEDIKVNPTSKKSLDVLNHLVHDALALIPDCLDFMSRVHNVELFKFCAIPQVMAIATLERLYNNPRVYTGVVKIRKGTSCELILETDSYAKFNAIFHDYSKMILARVSPSHYKGEETAALLKRIIILTQAGKDAQVASGSSNVSRGVLGYIPMTVTLALGAAAVYGIYSHREVIVKSLSR